MLYLSKLKDYIGIFYYRHGLFCASHPVWCLLVVSMVVCLCCYPLTNLQSFNSSLEQYKQPIGAFDGLEARTELNEFVEYEKLAGKPAWYNRIPVAYIQRIVVRSVLDIPSTTGPLPRSPHASNDSDSSSNKSTSQQQRPLYLIDAFRTPLAHLFDLNEFIRNFQTTTTLTASSSSREESSSSSHSNSNNKQTTLVGDLCVHVGELARKVKAPGRKEILKKKKSSEQTNNNEFNKHLLPEFNCLYLSPANFWSNDFNEFVNDDDLLATLTSQVDNDDDDESKVDDKDDELENKNYLATSMRELLFGVSWFSTLKTLGMDTKLGKKLTEADIQRKTSKTSIVFTYAITIALRKYDRTFLDELKRNLESRFGFKVLADDDFPATSSSVSSSSSSSSASSSAATIVDSEDIGNHIYNLKYTIQGLIYYIPFVLLYMLLFLYIYISVRKIEFVKSKWGLAFAAVTQVILSLCMSVGICAYFGLTPTLSGSEIFPYLIIFIGFENIVVLTKSVVSTPFDLDVRYRIALGLKKESWVITKILTFELIIICSGLFTMVPAIQEFCLFAYVGLLIDFFMQMMFFVTVLSIDIRRMELSDLNNRNNTKRSLPPAAAYPVNPIPNAGLKEKSKNNEIIRDQVEQSSTMSTSYNQVENINQQVNYRGAALDTNNTKTSGTGTNGSKPVIRSNNSNRLKRNSSSLRQMLLEANYGKFFSNKSAQFFYFWARTRLVQRVIMVLSALWIILIFYKSMLIVELMRNDVNVNKETVEALLPKGMSLPKLIKNNYLFTTPSSSSLPSTAKREPNDAKPPDDKGGQLPHAPTPPKTLTTTMDYFKQRIQNLVLPTARLKDEPPVYFPPTSSQEINQNTVEKEGGESNNELVDENESMYESWKSLSPNHWLTLFSFYNVSLYNRYVAILPQINLVRLINPSDLDRNQNQEEIKKYRTHVNFDPRTSRLILEANDDDTSDSTTPLFTHLFPSLNSIEKDGLRRSFGSNETSTIREENLDDRPYNYKRALMELFGIVVLGLPVIFVLVYSIILLYKCLCSKNYEEWRRRWTTSSIKRTYRIVHGRRSKSALKTRKKRKKRRNGSSGDEDDDDDYEDFDEYYQNSGSYSSTTVSSSSSESSTSTDDDNNDDDVIRVDTGEKEKLSDSELNDDRAGKNKKHKKRIKRGSVEEGDDGDLINKIINGKMDDIDMVPLKRFNTSWDDEASRHEYPLDVLACGSRLVATADISNRVNLWSLETDMIRRVTINNPLIGANGDLVKSIKLTDTTASFSPSTSIWSICFDPSDRYLFLGMSNGMLKSVDLATNTLADYETTAAIGITHLVSLEPSLNLSNKIQPGREGVNAGTIVILTARLNGFLELVEFSSHSPNSFVQLDSLDACHRSPILHLVYSGEYLLAVGQDCVLKVAKLTSQYLTTPSHHQHNILLTPMLSHLPNRYLNLMYELTEHGDSAITAMCIDRDNCINAVTGSQNGLVCVWNLLTGECTQKLNIQKNVHKRTNNLIGSNKWESESSSSSSSSSSIVKVEITDNLVVSLSSNHTMCIWNRQTGALMRDFQFLTSATLLADHQHRQCQQRQQRERTASSSTGATRHSSYSLAATLASLLRPSRWTSKSSSRIKSNLSNASKTSSRSPSVLRNAVEFLLPMNTEPPPPTMCLYSRKILITGGCSSIFLWNIWKGELIKKINIRKQQKNQYRNHHGAAQYVSYDENDDEVDDALALDNQIKDIRVIRQQFGQPQPLLSSRVMSTNKPSKLVLVTDYSDAVYVLKIPSSFTQTTSFD